jgi:hypothetical protein
MLQLAEFAWRSAFSTFDRFAHAPEGLAERAASLSSLLSANKAC